jgi:hypothetical protein
MSTSSSKLLSPPEILELGAEEVDALLDRLEAEVPVSEGALEIPGDGPREALVFGDTHGDWPSTLSVVDRFLNSSEKRMLIGLGDYVDRPPDDCPNGSVANSLYLLSLRAAYPERVVLLKGNHEAARRIPVLPHNLPEEVDELWGPEVDRYARIVGLLERGPWVATTSSGAYLAHAGFPSIFRDPGWRQQYATPSDDLLFETVWRDAAASGFDRGVGAPFTQAELLRFLGEINASVFLRGHDPDLTGQLLYQDRCLTLHTTRVYEHYGGVICARLPLHRPLLAGKEIPVEHLPTEGRSFPED